MATVFVLSMPKVLCDPTTFSVDVTALPQRCLRFYGAKVGDLGVLERCGNVALV